MIDISAQRNRNLASTARLLDSVDSLDDKAVGEPSELPGWNRAQVVTHLARNADGFAGMYAAARQGAVAQQYPHGRAGRAADIDAGRDLPASRLTADLRRSVDRLDLEAGGLSVDDWQREGEALGGRVALWETLLARRREVEVHHADLGIGYGPGDWPADFVSHELALIAPGLASRLEPASAVHLVTAEGEEWTVAGPGAAAGPAAVVTGPAGQILAWLLGRPNNLVDLPAIGSWQ